ncbi:alpha-tectorin-like [Cyprinus carpio]|uniref:Alpha-tectorin-like n=1 Tax=Cyprinus carpio TaxID=7962 RepID=A0A9Q9XKM4_CYPCA|nr:alpha-tectorin-like [Cyprinus carpio]
MKVVVVHIWLLTLLLNQRNSNLASALPSTLPSFLTSSAWTTPDSQNLGLSSSSSSSSQTSAPSSSSPSQFSPTSSSSITSSSVCNACTENEVCQERHGVYGCGCLQGQRPNPENFDAVESCASSTGSMSLSRCQLFESGFRSENLHLNDPGCRGTLENGRLVFHFDNEDHICGTTLMSNSTHFIYQNSIQCTPRNTEQSVITRERWMNITFSCVYPLIQNLSMSRCYPS